MAHQVRSLSCCFSLHFCNFLIKMIEIRDENIFTIFFGDFEIRSEMTGHQVMILG